MVKIGVHLRKLSPLKQGYHFFGTLCKIWPISIKLCVIIYLVHYVINIPRCKYTNRKIITKNAVHNRPIK